MESLINYRITDSSKNNTNFLNLRTFELFRGLKYFYALKLTI